ncbi:major facilitator superfamily domain-containing protein [Halenospora varia]|nr:major facilitator superfamily domain-containing protein [Halenospora varia]
MSADVVDPTLTPPKPVKLATTSGGNNAFHNFNNDFAHIADPNERRRLALAEIDKAPFGWYHVRTCVLAGVGFFTDSYDIFSVRLLTTMLGIVYWPHSKGIMPTNSDTTIKVATFGGTVLELIVIIFATLAQALTSNSPSMNIVGTITFWRVIIGIGIGGDCPLSSIITSYTRAMMGAVFAMQGISQLVADLIMLFITLSFKQSLLTTKIYATCQGVCGVAVDKMWRTLIESPPLSNTKHRGFGAVPACIALYYCLTIPETPRYTFDVARNVEKANEDVEAYIAGRSEGTPDEVKRVQGQIAANENMKVPKASFKDFFAYYSRWKNSRILLGTAGSWFLLDVAFYGVSLNNSIILATIGYSGGDTVYKTLLNPVIGNLIIVCAGAIPGYWVTVATIDTIGRKPIQLGGFMILTVIFIVMGFTYHRLSGHALLALYVFAQFVLLQFRPKRNNLHRPRRMLPNPYRSTSHGFSAASAKLGSIIAQAAIAPLRVRGATNAVPNPWLNHVLEIYAMFMFLGIFTTLCIKETKRVMLEVLSGEGDEGHDVEGSLQSGVEVGNEEGKGKKLDVDE